MLIDNLGRAFSAGQTIVYPGRVSSIVYLNYAKIEEVLPNSLVVKRLKGNKLVTLNALQNVLILDDEAAEIAKVQFESYGLTT